MFPFCTLEVSDIPINLIPLTPITLLFPFDIAYSKTNFPSSGNHFSQRGAGEERQDQSMKIRCDVCDKVEACVFCPADEAGLCHGCDRSIHHANKLASKHTRFSLIYPDSKEMAPACDICQERRAFLFCKEDRAILCRECDVSIHSVNELFQKNSRYLLTGVKLSSTASTYLASPSCSTINTVKGRAVVKNCIPTPNDVFSAPSTVDSLTSARYKVEDDLLSDTASASISSISEYLIETIPGWCVEDLLHLPFVS